jgi:hypothetical protein
MSGPVLRAARSTFLAASLALLASTMLSACRDSKADADIERVEFGVLFGGDIQDREELPLELDPAEQELGVRVAFRAPLTAPRLVSWELERPTTAKAPSGTAYAAELGQIRAAPGERRAEAKVHLRSNDLPGVWRIHVKVDGRAVLDRSVRVTPRAKR